MLSKVLAVATAAAAALLGLAAGSDPYHLPAPYHPAPYHPAPAPYHHPAPAPAPYHHPAPYPAYDAPPKPFAYEYGVKDEYSGAFFDKKEVQDDYGVVNGEYRVALPDGRTQIVTYHADQENGYVADVKYEGEPRYEPYHPKPAPPAPYVPAPAPYVPAPAPYRPAPAPYAPYAPAPVYRPAPYLA